MQPHEVQRSPEWHAFRKQGIGASDSACILGLNPWKTKRELWLEKLGFGKPVEMNKNIQRGIDLEEPALNWVMKELGIELKPVVLVHNSVSFMYASLDGYNEKLRILVEIKAPRKFYDDIPNIYYCQMHHQLCVSEFNMGLFVQYVNNTGKILEVKRDQSYIDNLLEKEASFWHCVTNFIDPELIN